MILSKFLCGLFVTLVSINVWAGNETKTLDFKNIVRHGLRESPNYKSIEAQIEESNVPIYKAKRLLSPKLNMRLGATDDRNEQVTNLRPIRSQGTLSEIEVSKYFSTGTALSFGMQMNRRNNTFIDDPIIQDRVIADPYYESIGMVSLKQKLWKDAFGFSVRKSLDAAHKMKMSQLSEVADSKEKWLLNVARLYDAVILSHLQLKASGEDLSRKQRLYKIIKIQKRRGAAEKSDVIEAEAALLYSEQNVIEKKYGWKRSWLALKNYVGYNSSEWDIVNPESLVLRPPQPLKKAIDLCSKKGITVNNNLQRGLELKREAAEINEEAAKNSMKPDFSFEAQIRNNGIDLAGSNFATKEVFQSENPMWYMGVAFKWDFSSYEERAKLSEVKAQMIKVQSLEQQNKNQLDESWSVHCEEIAHLRTKIDSFKKMNKKLKVRLGIEEKKFSNGYIPAINVIRAGNDYSQSNLSINLAEAELRKISWNIQYMAGEASKYLDSLQLVGSSL